MKPRNNALNNPFAFILPTMMLIYSMILMLALNYSLPVSAKQSISQLKSTEPGNQAILKLSHQNSLKKFMASSQLGMPTVTIHNQQTEYQLLNAQEGDAMSVLVLYPYSLLRTKASHIELTFDYKNCSQNAGLGLNSEQYSSFGIRLGDNTNSYLNLSAAAPLGRILPRGQASNGIDVIFDDIGVRSIALKPHRYFPSGFKYKSSALQYTNCKYKTVVLTISPDQYLTLKVGHATVFENVRIKREIIANMLSSPIIFFAGNSKLAKHNTEFAIRNIRYKIASNMFEA